MAALGLADRIAHVCIDEYNRHPELHPTVRTNGVPQFTVLAGVVFVRGSRASCVALGTGSKCLPENKLPKLGNSLHDSHAEVLARRAAIRWFYHEILEFVRTGISSWIERRDDELAQFKMKDGVQIWMYVSTLPCGDASTTALAINQPIEMAELKALSPMPTPERGTTARGRDNYNALGWLRTKPARADAPPTVSHACSDKLALWSLVGFQGALLFQLIGSIFFAGIVLGDVVNQFSEPETAQVRKDCQRALIDRLRPLPGGFSQIRSVPEVRILFTQVPFPHARSHIAAPNAASDPESHIWIGSGGLNTYGLAETIVNGLRRGVGSKRQNNPRFQPVTCKASMMRLHLETTRALNLSHPPSLTYYELKRSERASEYQSAKSILRSQGAPFQGWLISGREWEGFEV